ncbi:MAG TPA: hypothetical protein PLX15_05125 [Candidatus Woesearchaeota archaeon]|nr:hypothetical protein [Candidatus Woesearchaeota archaeon]
MNQIVFQIMVYLFPLIIIGFGIILKKLSGDEVISGRREIKILRDICFWISLGVVISLFLYLNYVVLLIVLTIHFLAHIMLKFVFNKKFPWGLFTLFLLVPNIENVFPLKIGIISSVIYLFSEISLFEEKKNKKEYFWFLGLYMVSSIVTILSMYLFQL